MLDCLDPNWRKNLDAMLEFYAKLDKPFYGVPYYIGIFFEGDYRQDLTTLINEQFPIKLDNPVRFPHVTLNYKPSNLEVLNLAGMYPTQNGGFKRTPEADCIGLEVQVQFYGKVERGGVQTLVCTTGGWYCGNDTPHLTVSCGDGVKPYHSNHVLTQGFERINPATVTGQLGVFMGKNLPGPYLKTAKKNQAPCGKVALSAEDLAHLPCEFDD